MKPKEILELWLYLFNNADAQGLAELYCKNAEYQPAVTSPIKSRQSIYHMFKAEFASSKIQYTTVNIFEDSDWVILEWINHSGLRGCEFFHILDAEIVFQRSY